MICNYPFVQDCLATLFLYLKIGLTETVFGIVKVTYFFNMKLLSLAQA